jgi:hypothetical protein
MRVGGTVRAASTLASSLPERPSTTTFTDSDAITAVSVISNRQTARKEMNLDRFLCLHLGVLGYLFELTGYECMGYQNGTSADSGWLSCL